MEVSCAAPNREAGSETLELMICRFYIVYVVWLAIETTIIWFLYPETKGPTLEELGRLFEDENPLSKGKLDLEKAHDDDAVHLEEKPKY
jgi:hypothetical protein